MYKNHLVDKLSTTQYLFKYLFQVGKMRTRHAQKVISINEKRAAIADIQINLVSSLHHGFFLSALSQNCLH